MADPYSGLLEPQTQATTTQAPQVQAQQYQNTAPEETVESRLTNLLKKDNPYLKLNETKAQQYANSRGLLNSTMAATAGQKAAIESALPIAQQDASFYQQRNLAGQQGEIQSALSGQQAQQQAGLYDVQGNVTSRLQGEQAQQAQSLEKLRQEWNKIDLNARVNLEYEKLDQTRKAQFDETSKAIGQDYMKDYMEIMLNPNFKTPEDRQAAANVLKANTESRYKMAAAIAGVALNWGDGTVAAPIAATPQAPAAPTPVTPQTPVAPAPVIPQVPASPQVPITVPATPSVPGTTTPPPPAADQVVVPWWEKLFPGYGHEYGGGP